MNNKGFIATSLIYSFFLIFITLFLTIIADYLQNKVLLNTIEKEIKENINSTLTLDDFEVGDFIALETEINDCKDTDKFNFYVVASKVSNSLILYSLTLTENSSDAVTFEDLKNDLFLKDDFSINYETGYQNATYYNKILKQVEGDYCIICIGDYCIGDYNVNISSSSDVLKEFITTDYVINTKKYRERYEITNETYLYVSNSSLTKCTGIDDAMGATYIMRLS